ncbi:MAG: glyceraldehyde 3-phosphate dehydrogenase NAD-binding domain-containing protein, partial [Pseudomonadota bacterium]
MTKIAINGLGRMGKLVLRSFLDDGLDAQIVLLNDAVGTPEIQAHLLEFDSVHGRWDADIEHDAESVAVNGERMALMASRTIEELPLAAFEVDLVVDCTGVFKTPEKVRPYYDAGVQKVVVS